MLSLLPRVDVDQLAVRDDLAVLVAESPDPAGIEVAVDVDAGQLGDLLASVDVAAGDAQAAVGPFARSARGDTRRSAAGWVAAGSGR